jgi:hypothetical protein
MLRLNMEDTVMTSAMKLLALVPVFGLMSSTAALALTCNGDQQFQVRHSTQTANTTIPLGPSVPIPTDLLVLGPSVVGADTYAVTFAGRSRVAATGPANLILVWAQYSLNGGVTWTDMQPNGSSVFHDGLATFENTSMTWCNRLTVAADIRFRVRAQKLGAGNGFIANYTLRVERSQ